jgi:penicillin-binding protein 1C
VAGHVREPEEALAAVPHNVVRHAICALSGMRATAACPTRVNEWLPAGEEGLPCSWHHESDEGLLVVWPAVYRQWAQQHGLLEDLGPRRVSLAGDDEIVDMSRRTVESHAARFAIANPPLGAVYLIDPTLRREFQTLSLRAVADRDAGEIEWAVDGQHVGRAAADKPLAWALVPGSHRVVARDERGRAAETSIVVK